MTDKKRKDIGFQWTEDTIEQLHNLMSKEGIPKNQQSEFAEKKFLDGCNRKYTKDYMLHQGLIGQPMICLDCHKEYPRGTWGRVKGDGTFICQECFAKRWTTPNIERERTRLLELKNDINYAHMDLTAVSLEVDTKKKELEYANDLRSMEDIYNAKKDSLDQIIEEKERQVEAVTYELNVGNELKSSLPELQEKKERLQEEVKDLQIKVNGRKLDSEWNELWKLLDAMFANRPGTKEEKELFEKLKQEYLKCVNLRDGIIADANGCLDQLIEKKNRELRQGETPST